MTTPLQKSPGLKAIEYAQNQLGVNIIFDDAKKEHTNLDRTLTLLSEARDKLRDIEARIEDQHMLVMSDEWGKHPDMSATAMKEHMRMALNRSTDVRELREQVIKIRGDIDGLEADEKMCETAIKIGLARMNELGGYFQYLATIKLAELKRGEVNNAPAVSNTVPGW